LYKVKELRYSVGLFGKSINQNLLGKYKGGFVTQNSALIFATQTFRDVSQRDFIIQLSVIRDLPKG